MAFAVPVESPGVAVSEPLSEVRAQPTEIRSTTTKRNVAIRTNQVDGISVDAEPGQCLAARVNERSPRLLAIQIVNRQRLRESICQRCDVARIPCANWAAEQKVHVRTVERLLQVRVLPVANDSRIGQAVARVRPFRQSGFTFGDCRTLAVANPELRNEVERERPDQPARQRWRNDSPNHHSTQRRHWPAARDRTCKDAKHTIRGSQ